MSESNNSALEENGYIQPLVHVNAANYLTQINPLIRDFVKKQWAEEKELKVKDFLQYNQYAEKLLELLEEKNQEKKMPVNKEVLVGTSRHSGCIQGDDDDRDDSAGYWLWFEEHILEEFEKQTGKSYVDESFISLERIKDHEAIA